MDKKILFAFGLIAFTNTVKAELINFETFGNNYMTGIASGACLNQVEGTEACTLSGSEFTERGMSLSFTDFIVQPSVISDSALKIVRVGADSNSDSDGFWPIDTPDPKDAFGDFFLTTEFQNNTHFSLTFDSFVDLTFDIADIDGNNNTIEKFIFKTYRDGTEIDTLEVNGNDSVDSLIGAGVTGAIGDAKVTNFSFRNIDRVEILGTTNLGNRNIGYGLDNIEFFAVPEPGTVFIFLSGLASLGLARKRKVKMRNQT